MCMSCILEQHICDPYVTYSCILPHPLRLSWRSQRTNKQFNLPVCIPIYCFLNTFHMYNLDPVLPARWCFLPAVYTCLNGVALAQHSEATLTTRVIRMFDCMYVCGKLDHYSLSRKNIALRAPSTRASVILVEFESTHTEARLAVVDGCVAWFEVCVCIAADFPQ